jgi:alpha-tubulin suppressor-like RCC1 family protein
VTADLREIGGEAEQALTAGDNGTWRWSGQVMPDVSGERLITITAVDSQSLKTNVSKRFRVFDTEKAIAIQAGNGEPCLALMADGTVVAWNYATGARVDTPAGLTDITAIASNVDSAHFLALKTDGTVVAWGCDAAPENDFGQCDVPAGLTDVVAVAASRWSRSLALKADGTIVSWGENSIYYIPAQPADVVALSSGWTDFALKADGTVVHMNLNEENAAAGLCDVIALASGYECLLPVTGNGTVVQVPARDYSVKELPVRVGTGNATAVAAGLFNNIALQKDGSVVVWQNRATGFAADIGSLVFHRHSDICAVGALRLNTQVQYMALSESGRVIVWEEPWVRNVITELPVPEELQ